MSNRKKAGVVPYIIENNIIKMMFMKSAKNPELGWQLAKGNQKKDESKKKAAFREASEELGLFKPNCDNIKGVGNFGGISLYIAEVLSMSQFGDPDESEVSDVAWLTLEEFSEEGRMSQRHIVKEIHSIINKTLET